MEVGARAMSVVCPHCNRRLILEDMRISRYHAVNELATCGKVVVDKRGHLVAPTIKAGNLVVRGKIQGDVRVTERVKLHKTAWVKADIAAPGLRVESGAALQGHLRIGPGTNDEDDESQ